MNYLIGSFHKISWTTNLEREYPDNVITIIEKKNAGELNFHHT